MNVFVPQPVRKHMAMIETLHDPWSHVKYRMWRMGVKPGDIVLFQHSDILWYGNVPMIRSNKPLDTMEGRFAGGVYRSSNLEFEFSQRVLPHHWQKWPDRFMFRDTGTKYLTVMLTQECVNTLQEGPGSLDGVPYPFDQTVSHIGERDIIAFVYITLPSHR